MDTNANATDLNEDPETKPLLSTPSSSASDIPPPKNCCQSLFGRLLLLFLASGMAFGSQVAYDTVGAGAPTIRKTLNIDSEAIGDLYSIYHLPNCIMVILGGVLADRIGLTSSSILFSIMICAGTTIVAFASPYSFRGMLFGRMVFGMGAESLNVVQISMLAKWFSGTTLHRAKDTFPSFATSMAVAYSMSALGTVLAYDAVPMVSETGGIGFAMWSVGTFPCFISLLMCMAVPWVELYVFPDGQGAIARSVQANSPRNSYTDAAPSSSSPISPSSPSLVSPTPKVTLTSILNGIFQFSSLYWWLILFMVAYLASQQVWSNFATDIFVERFQLTYVFAGRLNSIPTTIGVILCPLLGLYVDTYGNTLKMMFIGSLMLLCGHVLLTFLSKNGQDRSNALFIGCEVLLGLGMGIIQSSLWPTLAQAVPPKLITTAMGIASALSNSAMVIFPLLTGFIHDAYGSYSVVMFMFVTSDTICLVLVIVLLMGVALERRTSDGYSDGLIQNGINGGSGLPVVLKSGMRRDTFFLGKNRSDGDVQNGLDEEDDGAV